MKILSIILLTLFVFIGSHSNGQKSSATRSQTETWLLEKMNKYVAANTIKCYKIFQDDPSTTTHCLTYRNVSFSFSGDNLIINMSVEKSIKDKLDSRFTRNVTIPLYALSNDFYITTNSLFFSTKYSAIKVEDSNGNPEKQGSYSLSFKTNEEDDFESRFDKAMNHLRTFIKKPKSSEAF